MENIPKCNNKSCHRASSQMFVHAVQWLAFHLSAQVSVIPPFEETKRTKLSNVTPRRSLEADYEYQSPSWPLVERKYLAAFGPRRQHVCCRQMTQQRAVTPRPKTALSSIPAVGCRPGRSPECQSFIRALACVPPANSCAPMLLRLHIACDLMAGSAQRHSGKREREREALCLNTGSSALKMHRGLSKEIWLIGLQLNGDLMLEGTISNGSMFHLRI